jgi:hypothetical protein
MNELKDRQSDTEPRTASDLKQLTAIGAWCTPEFLIRSSQAAQSTHRLSDASDGTISAATGQYLASRQVLAGPGQIDHAIAELRQLLESACDDREGKERSALLQTWIAVERCLSEDEHRQLRGAVLARLFPHSKEPADLSRGVATLAGGH